MPAIKHPLEQHWDSLVKANHSIKGTSDYTAAMSAACCCICMKNTRPTAINLSHAWHKVVAKGAEEGGGAAASSSQQAASNVRYFDGSADLGPAAVQKDWQDAEAAAAALGIDCMGMWCHKACSIEAVRRLKAGVGAPASAAPPIIASALAGGDGAATVLETDPSNLMMGGWLQQHHQSQQQTHTMGTRSVES
jgi:hypothetical protein